MPLFLWTEGEFNERMPGSAIYRIGYERWSRNIAGGVGECPRITGGACGVAHEALRRIGVGEGSTLSGRWRGMAPRQGMTRAAHDPQPAPQQRNSSIGGEGGSVE